MPRLSSPRLRVLLLCDDGWEFQANLLEHMGAFSLYSRHEIYRLNPRRWVRSDPPDLTRFDVVVIHYSIWILQDSYLPEPVRQAIRSFGGLKVQFLQDEYRQVNATVDSLLELGIGVLFTVCPPDTAGLLYERLERGGVRLVTTLTGYVPAAAARFRTSPIAERRVHAAYRSREVPFALGAFAQEKLWIGKRFAALAETHGLVHDISWRLDDRIYGSEWLSFQASAKAVLGTGSGASIADFDGDVERRVTAYLEANPRASFKEVHGEVLEPFEGNAVIDVISPRIFEAAALRTALVLFPGEYSGVVEAERHYIMLKRDLSNFEEVARYLRDDQYLQDLADRTYDEIVGSGRYSFLAFIQGFDEVVSQERQRRVGLPERAPGRRTGISTRGDRRSTIAEATRRLVWKFKLTWQWRRHLFSRWLDEFDPDGSWAAWIVSQCRLGAAIAGRWCVNADYRRVVWAALKWTEASFQERARVVVQAARASVAGDWPNVEVTCKRSTQVESNQAEKAVDPAAEKTSICLVRRGTIVPESYLLKVPHEYELPTLARFVRAKPDVIRGLFGQDDARRGL